jgi:hypothetical protein
MAPFLVALADSSTVTTEYAHAVIGRRSCHPQDSGFRESHHLPGNDGAILCSRRQLHLVRAKRAPGLVLNEWFLCGCTNDTWSSFSVNDHFVHSCRIWNYTGHVRPDGTSVSGLDCCELSPGRKPNASCQGYALIDQLIGLIAAATVGSDIAPESGGLTDGVIRFPPIPAAVAPA